MRNKSSDKVNLVLTKPQKELRRKHGTPAEFATATYQAVPEFISMDEARAAVDKYNAEWREAGDER